MFLFFVFFSPFWVHFDVPKMSFLGTVLRSPNRSILDRFWGPQIDRFWIDFGVQKGVRFGTPKGTKFIAFPLDQGQKWKTQARRDLPRHAHAEGLGCRARSKCQTTREGHWSRGRPVRC